MTRSEYVKKLNEICNSEFISAIELVRDLDIAHNTLMKIRRNADACSMKTMSKIKKFIDKWEAKHMSASD